MNARPNFATRSSFLTFAAATLAAVIALGILWAVVVAFQSKGTPMERLVAAERACAGHAYLSEREACMKQWLAVSRATSVARQ